MFTGYSYTLKCGNCAEKEVMLLKLARVPEPELVGTLSAVFKLFELEF